MTGVGDTVEVKATTYTITAGDRIPSCKNKVLDVTVKEENGQNYFMVISTTGSNTNIILSANKLSASQRAAIADTLKNYKNGPFSSNTTNEFYSIKENTHFTIAGAEVTYNKAAGTVTIHATEYWNQVLNLSCATDEGKNPEVQIVNPYTPATLDIQITKQVASGDKTKYFKFKVTSDDFSTVNNVSLTNRDGTSQKPQEWFYLKDGESATLHGLKKDYIFTIEEEKENSVEYDTTATENIKVEAGNTKSFRYKVVEENGQLVLQPIAEKGNSLLSGKLNITDGKVVVTNSAAATSLTVTKNVVEGNAKAPDNAEFTFRLTVSDDVKVYSKVKLTKAGNDITTSSVQSNKYQWEFTLKNGESVHISGIRIDDENVKVEEIINDSHYTTKYKVGTDAEKKGTTAAIPTATLSEHQSSGTTVEFTNTYSVPNLKSMTIRKKVTGEFGDRDKSFTFSVKLTKGNADITGEFFTGENGANVTNLKSFTLKHDQQVTLENIPVGTTITVTEAETGANDYETKATNYKDYIKTGDRTFVYKVVEQGGKAVLEAKNSVLGIEVDKTVKDNAIVVTNRFDGTPDTGVLLDTLPYLILLAVAVAGGVLVVVRKRKHRDE